MSETRRTSGGPADRLARIGAVLVGIGVIATVITVLPLLLDAEPLPVGFYLLCFLAPIGLGVILVALWRRARNRGAALRAAADR